MLMLNMLRPKRNRDRDRVRQQVMGVVRLLLHMVPPG